MANILVVDDELDVTWALERGLSTQGHSVVVAETGSLALELMRRQRPDIVILDIVMPGMDGIEVCRRLRTNPTLAAVPILFLTAKGEVEDRIEGLEAGGDDYLSKPFDLRELYLRVEALLRRSRHGSSEATPSSLIVGGLCLSENDYRLKVDGQQVQLTPVEFDLLHHLMSHAGEVLSSERLLQEVWEYPPGTGDPATVRWHIKNLRAKIEPDPAQPTYIQTVPRFGYTIAVE